MLEPGIDFTTVPDAQRSTSVGIDGRGWVVLMAAMVVIGVLTLRSPPTPQLPYRIVVNSAVAWMADALPGIGPKTRESMLHKIRLGAFESLPARAQHIAGQVFIRPAKDQPPTGRPDPPAP